MNAAAKKASAPGRKLTILVADDMPDVVKTLAVILQDEGHKVYEVYSGNHVVELAVRMTPDVCILDIDMPGQSGYAVAGDLRSQLGPNCPTLIAISGKWTKPNDRLLATTVGFQHFLLKPADPSELIDLLNQIAEGGPQRA